MFLFSIKLRYNTPDASLGGTAQFNGNISATVWNTQGKKKRAYSYAYDELNRLLSSNHKVYSTTWGDSTSYEEKNISYDKNGNITHLLRTNQTGGTLNDFTYTYSETNQLKHLNVGDNYIYDSNGNMTTDGLKGFSVTYNLLNLPSQVSKSSDNISYIYTAAGAKLAKFQNGTLNQLYAGSLVYNSSKLLDYILNDEGLVVKQGGGFEYQYFMKDHLGNTRAVFKDSLGIAKIKQVADYYPFGSRFVPFSPESSNKYLYNGKELQDDVIGGTPLNWLDYGVRFYDPTIGRFTTVDPLSEKMRRWSPYVYCADNPIRFIDPDGRVFMLPGDKKAQDAYVAMLHNSTGNNYSIVDNKLTLVGADASFKGKKSETLINTIQKGMDSKDVYTLNLVGAKKDDKGVFIDSYKDKKIDVSDLTKMGNASIALQGAAIGHFLNEVQEPGGFDQAHKASLGVEGKIYGEMVGDKTITTRMDQTSAVTDGYQTVTYQYNSTNNFEILQGAQATGKSETINIGGVEFKAPVYESTGELKSVKKLP
ncbi:MAG: RHS repeat-associated core domain-containing protein [Bacteroidales bacterium]|nr:RHS repeat-associated core domain-containing protein [Bacteroidales bacterium]